MPTKTPYYGKYFLTCRRRTGTCIWSQTTCCRVQNHPVQRWSSSDTTQHSPRSDRIIFSAIQPTGIPHLGNYLGALREWVRLQNEATEGTKLFFSIADLHSLTLPQDAHQLKKWRKQALATLLAVGLDPAQSTLFYQSAV